MTTAHTTHLCITMEDAATISRLLGAVRTAGGLSGAAADVVNRFQETYLRHIPEVDPTTPATPEPAPGGKVVTGKATVEVKINT